MLRKNHFLILFFLLFSISALAQEESDKVQAPPVKKEGAQPGKLKVGAYTIERFESGMFNEAIRKKQQEISKIRISTMVKYRELLTNPYYEKKDEVYFRLAEACWEENHYQYLLRRADYDKAYDAFEAGTLKEKPEEPREDYKECLDYYKKVLQEFPGYGRIDEVIYYLGKGMLQDGKAKKNKNLEKEGIDYLTRLVQNHPNSKFIANTHLALAEYYFENNSLYYAKTNYEKIVTNYKTSSMFNYALYKLAWVYYNLSEFDKAIETFKKVIAIVGKEQEKGKIEFKNQAVKDLIQTYAEIENGWQHAREYFLTIMDEKDTYKKLRALADLYVAQDKDIEAIELVRHFIQREKTTENIPGYYKEIMEIHKKTNDIPHLDKVTYEILDYFKDKDTWMTVNKNNEDAVTEARKLGETYLLFLANHFHREAERLKSNEFYKMASDRYAIFLERFPDSKSCYIVNFYYAEILYHQIQDYQKAAEQYERVIERDTKGEYVEDAALGVIYANEEMMVKAGIQERSKKKSGGIETMKIDPKTLDAPIPETPLHKLEEAYIRAADKYVDLLSVLLKDPEVRKKNPERGGKIPEIMFIAAQVLYRHGKFKDSVERLKILFSYDPQHEFAAYAVFTLLDCYKRLQRWDKVEEWARKLIEAKNFKVRSKKDLEKIVAISITENAKQLSIEKKYDDTVKNFMRAYEEFKADKEISGNALFNVAAAYENSRMIEKAITTYKRVVKEYPTMEIAPRAQFAIAEIFEAQTQFAKAADSFEQMEKFEKDIDMYKKQMDQEKDPEKQKAYKEILQMIPDSIINAGLIREALGDYNGAIKAYQKYIKLYPKNDDIPTVDFRIGLVYELMDNPKSLKQAVDHFLAYAKKYNSQTKVVVEAYSRAGADLKKIDRIKNRKTVIQYFQTAIKEFVKLADKPEEIEKCKWFAAQAAFEMSEYLYEDYSAYKVPPDFKKLLKALTEKAKLFKEAEKSYNEVLNYKSGYWTAGALFRIGLVYNEFVKELNSIPIPEGLTPEQEQEYVGTLEERIRPAEEKALGAFDQALSLAHEQKVYNDWSKKCGEYAAKVNPQSYPIFGDEAVSPDKYKDTLLSASFIRSLKRGNVEVKYFKEGKKEKK
jgi:tetratricopeptide (TPR) repeat protein